MNRIQIWLPDDVFVRAEKLCKTLNLSLSELALRGIESCLTDDGQIDKKENEWHPPKPRRLGWKGLSDIEIKAQIYGDCLNPKNS